MEEKNLRLIAICVVSGMIIGITMEFLIVNPQLNQKDREIAISNDLNKDKSDQIKVLEEQIKTQPQIFQPDAGIVSNIQKPPFKIIGNAVLGDENKGHAIFKVECNGTEKEYFIYEGRLFHNNDGQYDWVGGIVC